MNRREKLRLIKREQDQCERRELLLSLENKTDEELATLRAQVEAEIAGG